MSTAASQVYARQLLSQKLGYPLFVPEPNESLPDEYRARGVGIGDVGIIAPDGSFTFAFNHVPQLTLLLIAMVFPLDSKLLKSTHSVFQGGKTCTRKAPRLLVHLSRKSVSISKVV